MEKVLALPFTQLFILYTFFFSIVFTHQMLKQYIRVYEQKGGGKNGNYVLSISAVSIPSIPKHEEKWENFI